MSLKSQQAQARQKFEDTFKTNEHMEGFYHYSSDHDRHAELENFLDTIVEEARNSGIEKMKDEVRKGLANCTQYRSDSAKFKACRLYNEYILSLLNYSPDRSSEE